MASPSTLHTDLPSSEEWKDLLEEMLPPQGQWSEEQYLVLTEHLNRPVEFTDGFLEVLPTPTDKHQAILGFLYVAFLNFINPRGGKVRFAGEHLSEPWQGFMEGAVQTGEEAADSLIKFGC